MININLSGFLVIRKEFLVIGRFDVKTMSIVEVDTNKLSEDELVEALQSGELMILLEKTILRQEYEEINLEADAELA